MPPREGSIHRAVISEFDPGRRKTDLAERSISLLANSISFRGNDRGRNLPPVFSRPSCSFHETSNSSAICRLRVSRMGDATCKRRSSLPGPSRSFIASLVGVFPAVYVRLVKAITRSH